ncbi:hypothetical protein GCM10028798_12720 [Humibacter antri]
MAVAARLLSHDIDTSLETIAVEAGLSRRAVYGHFATRDDLVREVLLRGAERIGSSILSIEHPDARVEIALYGATLWSEVQHARVTAEFAVRGPYTDLVGKALEPARAKLRATVRRGVRGGVLRRDIHPDPLARLIEGAALDVLTEATHEGLDARAGHTLVMRTALSVAGLSWREADALVEGTQELAYRGGSPPAPEPAVAPGTATAPETATDEAVSNTRVEATYATAGMRGASRRGQS